MQIGAFGWDHDEWQGPFYPQDLPRDWRLAYYAGEFSAVIVPVAEWVALTPERAEEWRQDTSETFRFYLELPIEDSRSTEPGRLLATAALLSERLGGFVADLGCEAPFRAALAPGWAALAPVCLISEQGNADERVDTCALDGDCGGPGRLAVRRCTENHVEPRALREMLERLSATGASETLLWCGREPGALELMHQARVIADLMGI